MRKSTFLKESESVGSKSQYFHLVSAFVIKKREVERQKEALLASLLVSDFWTATLIFTVKGISFLCAL